MNEAGRERKILQLIDQIDNKNMVILDLLLEIHRLRQLLKQHNITHNRRSTPKQSSQKHKEKPEQ